MATGDAGNYDCVVSGACGSPVASQTAALVVCQPPSITAHPVGATRCVGDPVTFSVSANGTGLTYQWRKGGVNIGAATASSYTIAAVATGDAGSYDCVVSGECGSPVTSLAATLTVNSPPTITGQPSGATRNVGDSVTFSVAATGTSLTYQWRKGGVNIGGATGSGYTIAAVALADAGSYDCLVSGVCGPPVTSQVATLTVNQAGVAPSITVQPQSRTNLAGTTATFSVTASGSAPLSYQWRFNDTNLVDGARISGTASPSLALSSVQTNDAGSYTVIITNAFGSVTSQVAMLTLDTAASGTKRWEFTAGAEVVSSPAIGADGTVYVGCNDGKVYALEGATGVKRWEFATGAPFGYSSPAIGIDGTVYVASVYPRVYALDGATGTKRWEFIAPEEPATSPAIGADGTVYVGTRGALYALNGGTGALRWRLDTGYVESSPSVGSDGTIYFACYGKIYAADGVTGVIRWSPDIGDSSSYASTAIGADGTIYMGCSRWGNYNIGNNRVCAFDGATGAKRWEVATASWIYSSAAIGVDGTVYIASEDAKVLALNGATGAQRWAFTPNTGFMCSPAIGADNTIYIGAGDGKLRALDGATGTKRWEFTTGGSIQSSAAIAADGTLYFGSNDRKVYALSSNSLGGPASSPWPMFCQNARRTGRVETGSPTAPLITAQPQSRTNSVGTTATFSVTATGTESLSYQWRRDSVNLSDGSNVVGATTPTLTLANVQPADAANYQVVVANASGSVTSAVATLTVIVPPAITGQPQSRTNIAATTAAFSVTATGTAPLSYQWLKNGVNLASGGSVSGATSASLTLANVQPMDAANYQVVVANAAGSVTSAVATLTISPAVPGTKRWEFATGDVVTSSPAIGVDGTVYVGSGDRKLYALDGATGAKRWEFQTGSWVSSAPAIGADGTVYVGSYDCKVYALNGATGAKRWEFATGSAVVNCPAIGVDGMVYVGSQDGKCYALDEATGQQRWAFATGGEVNSSPAIGSDGTVYVGSLDGKLYALNGATGAKRWEFLTGNQIHSSPTIGADGTVYVGSYDKKVYALNGATGQQRWVFATGRCIWCGPTIGPDGTVYIGSHDYSVYALNGATGQRRWVFATGSYVGSSPAIGVDGTLYVGSVDGKLYALDSASGQKRWEFATGRDISPSPAIAADGTVYFGSHDHKVYALYSSSVGGPANSPWPMFHQNVRHAGRAGTASPTAPVITTQPASQTVAVGTSVTFGVIAAGAAPLAYQWRFNGTGLPATTNANLTLTNAGLSDAGNYAVAVTNASGSVTSAVATLTLTSAIPSITLTGVGHDGYVANGTVFFDANRNGQQDEDEPYTTTDDQGHFELVVPLDQFDTNHNGQLDPEEGALVLKGGLDIATGQPLRTALTAPAGATVVSPLTTLLQEVLDQTPGLSVSNAQKRVQEALGVSNRVDLTNYDPFAAARTNDPMAVSVLRAAAQVQDTTVQITMLMEGASTNQSTEQLARLVTSALAAQVRTNALCSLSAPQDIRNLVTQSVSRASITFGTNITDGAAQIIAQVNQLKDQAAASASNALSAAEEISRIQGMAQGSIADDLSLVAANAKLIDDAVAANTGSALQTRVDAAPVGDVTGQETRPGTFAFSLPEFRVLEDGTPLSAVKVTRTDGNKWDVALRITLSDGTARYADGHYSATNIDLRFADGQISQTVDLAPVLMDDSQVETNETIYLTLSLLPGAPPGTRIGTQNQAVVTIVDNDSPGTFAFTEAEYRVEEDGTAVKPVIVTRDGGSAGEVSVIVTPIEIPGGAKAHEDYDPTPVTVTFLPGNMNRIVTIPLVPDSLIEGDEPLQLTLSLAAGAPAGASLGVRTAATLIIQDSTATSPYVKLGVLSAGPAGEFRFSLTGTPGRSCTVQQSTNLVDWVDQSTHVLGETPLVILGAQMQSTARRFYRAIMPP